MKTVRVKVKLTAEMLRIPELRDFVGKDVEVTVTERSNGGAPARPDIKPFDFKANRGGWPDDIDDGFDEALRRWRNEEMAREMPG